MFRAAPSSVWRALPAPDDNFRSGAAVLTRAGFEQAIDAAPQRIVRVACQQRRPAKIARLAIEVIRNHPPGANSRAILACVSAEIDFSCGWPDKRDTPRASCSRFRFRAIRFGPPFRGFPAAFWRPRPGPCHRWAIAWTIVASACLSKAEAVSISARDLYRSCAERWWPDRRTVRLAASKDGRWKWIHHDGHPPVPGGWDTSVAGTNQRNRSSASESSGCLRASQTRWEAGYGLLLSNKHRNI